MRQSGGSVARPLNVAGGGDAGGDFRRPSAGGGRIRSEAVTAGTSIRRSMRSISGPEIRV
jgi:hypothetical protein